VSEFRLLLRTQYMTDSRIALSVLNESTQSRTPKQLVINVDSIGVSYTARFFQEPGSYHLVSPKMPKWI